MPETVAEYQLLDQIGTGTLGELHRARDLRRGRTVALRLIDPAIVGDERRLSALFDAARRLASVSHPAVAAVYDSGSVDGRACIASEFVAGQRLSVLLGGSALSPRRALEVAAQVADGLAAAHAAGIVHEALSAGSVIVTAKGAVKLLDTGMRPWTRLAAGPPRDDMTALGALLFEMLVGRPLRIGWPAELRVREIPADVQPVLDALTSTDPARRFESIATAATLLRGLAESHEAGAVPPASHVHVERNGRIGAIGLLMVFVLVLAAVAWWVLQRAA